MTGCGDTGRAATGQRKRRDEKHAATEEDRPYSKVLGDRHGVAPRVPAPGAQGLDDHPNEEVVVAVEHPQWRDFVAARLLRRT